ncbi:MAG: hypothetical protein A2001_13915 [Treponema sp. GWC1_61_84]|nr:MAG: hypothetical protein A2001_13915 [Treponema sp. GWC1_61_84]
MTALFFGGAYKFPVAKQVKGCREAIKLALEDSRHPHTIEIGDNHGLIARYERKMIRGSYVFCKTG